MEIKPVETKVIYLSSNEVGKIHDKKMVDEQLKKRRITISAFAAPADDAAGGLSLFQRN